MANVGKSGSHQKRLKQLKEEIEILRVSLVRRRREEQQMIRCIPEQFPQGVPFGFL